MARVIYSRRSIPRPPPRPRYPAEQRDGFSPIQQCEVWDLMTGKSRLMPLIDARTALEMGNSRYTDFEPTAEQIEEYRRAHPQGKSQ